MRVVPPLDAVAVDDPDDVMLGPEDDGRRDLKKEAMSIEHLLFHGLRTLIAAFVGKHWRSGSRIDGGRTSRTGTGRLAI